MRLWRPNGSDQLYTLHNSRLWEMCCIFFKLVFGRRKYWPFGDTPPHPLRDRKPFRTFAILVQAVHLVAIVQ